MEGAFSRPKISAQVKVLDGLHGQTKDVQRQFNMTKRSTVLQKPPQDVPEPLQRTFIAEWREHRRMSQTTLAEAVGLSTATISQIENVKTGYKQQHLEAIARVLKVHPIDLLVCDPGDHPKGIWTTVKAILA